MTGVSQHPGDLDARQLGIIIKMLNARDSRTRDVAVRALKNIDPGEVAVLLRDPALSREALVYFARHAGDRRDWVESLLFNTSLPDEDKAVLTSARGVIPPSEEEAPEESDQDLTLSQRIQRMRVGEKIHLAMKGDKEARTILVKDNNREVFMAVLSNPGMKESEVEMLAKNTGTNADILRAIGRNREWVANRNIRFSLVTNAKTPVGITIRFLPRLVKKELEFVSKSRSLSMVLRTNAQRLLKAKTKGR